MTLFAKRRSLILLAGVLAVQSLCVLAFRVYSWYAGSRDAAFNANLQASAGVVAYPAPAQTQKPPKSWTVELRVQVGETAPPFSLRNPEGKETSFKDLLGKTPIVVEFGSFT